MLYVDDLVVTRNINEKIAWLKKRLEGKFKMIGLGQSRHYLGINFTFTKERIFLSQKPYIEKMFQIFGMANCNPTKVPMVEGIKLEANMNYQKVDSIMYKKMVGKPIYLVNIKLNINFSIFIMSPFLTNPPNTASKC
jgi:hypothetical protein